MYTHAVLVLVKCGAHGVLNERIGQYDSLISLSVGTSSMSRRQTLRGWSSMNIWTKLGNTGMWMLTCVVIIVKLNDALAIGLGCVYTVSSGAPLMRKLYFKLYIGGVGFICVRHSEKGNLRAVSLQSKLKRILFWNINF